jgi:hypothetical protein
VNKEEADARVAKTRELRRQLENCTNIVEHNRICQEYYHATGGTMLFRVDQYDELYDKATPEEHEEARRLYPS